MPWEMERVWPIRTQTRSSTEGQRTEEGEGAPRIASPIRMGSSQDRNQSIYHHVSCPFFARNLPIKIFICKHTCRCACVCTGPWDGVPPV